MTFRTWEGFGAMLSLSILFSSMVAVLVVYEPLRGSRWISWVVVSAYFVFEVMGVVSWGYCALVHPGVRKKKFGTPRDTPHNVPRRTHVSQAPGNSSKLAPLPPILDGDEERGVEGPINTYTQTQIKHHAQAGIRIQNDAHAHTHTHTQICVQEPTHTPLQSPRAHTYSVTTAHSGGYQQQTGDNWTENIDESTPMLLDQAPDSQSYRSLCSQSSIISGFCRECNVVIDLSTKHCSRCGVCVPNFDHHCVFMNNCIGEGNYTAFILTCLCFFVSSAIEAAWCFYLGYTDTYSRTWPLYVSALLGLTAVGVFGMLLFFHWHLHRIGLSTYEYFLSQNQWGGRLYDGLSSLGSTS